MGGRQHGGHRRVRRLAARLRGRARCQRRCRSGPALDDGCLPRHHGALRRSDCPGPRGGIAALDPSGQRRRARPLPASVVSNRRGHRGAYGSPAHRRHLKPSHVRPEQYLPGDSRPHWLRCPQSTASVPPRAVPFGARRRARDGHSALLPTGKRGVHEPLVGGSGRDLVFRWMDSLCLRPRALSGLLPLHPRRMAAAARGLSVARLLHPLHRLSLLHRPALLAVGCAVPGLDPVKSPHGHHAAVGGGSRGHGSAGPPLVAGCGRCAHAHRGRRLRHPYRRAYRALSRTDGLGGQRRHARHGLRHDAGDALVRAPAP